MRVAEGLQKAIDEVNMFTVSDFAHVQSTLRENGIIPSNCSSIACGRQAGRLLGVRLIANGEIRKVGSRLFLEARILHVATGKVVQTVNEQYDDGNPDTVIDDMPSVVAKLVGKAPVSPSQPVPQQPVSTPPDEGDIIIDTQPTEEPVIMTREPEDIFTIGGPEDTDSEQAAARKKGGAMKWALIGLLVAGGVGAGVLIAQKGGSGSGDNGGNTGGAITTLPGNPKFP
jgi:hypothetical protein